MAEIDEESLLALRAVASAPAVKYKARWMCGYRFSGPHTVWHAPYFSIEALAFHTYGWYAYLHAYYVYTILKQFAHYRHRVDPLQHPSPHSLKAVLFFAAATLLFAYAIFLLYLSMVSDPGRIHADNYESFVRVPIDTTAQKLAFCEICQIYKPPRTSHCSRCRACILGMDHHCTFIHNCVGIRNYKLFYNTVEITWLFNLFMFVFMVGLDFLIIKRTTTDAIDPTGFFTGTDDKKMLVYQISRGYVHYSVVLNTITCTASLVWLTYLRQNIFQNAMYAVTTLECLKHLRDQRRSLKAGPSKATTSKMDHLLPNNVYPPNQEVITIDTAQHDGAIKGNSSEKTLFRFHSGDELYNVQKIFGPSILDWYKIFDNQIFIDYAYENKLHTTYAGKDKDPKVISKNPNYHAGTEFIDYSAIGNDTPGNDKARHQLYIDYD